MNIRSFWVCIALVGICGISCAAHKRHNGYDADEEGSGPISHKSPVRAAGASLVLEKSDTELIKRWLAAHHLPTENLQRNLIFKDCREKNELALIMQIPRKIWQERQQKLSFKSDSHLLWYGAIGAGAGLLVGGLYYYYHATSSDPAWKKYADGGLGLVLGMCGGTLAYLSRELFTEQREEREIVPCDLRSDKKTVKIYLPGLVKELSKLPSSAIHRDALRRITVGDG